MIDMSIISSHSDMYTAYNSESISQETASYFLNSSLYSNNNFFRRLQHTLPGGLKLFRLYESALTVAHDAKSRIQFLKRCLQECVLPASIPVHDNLYELPFPEQHRQSLQDRIDQQREDLGRLFMNVRSAQRAYKASIPLHLQVD